MPRSSRKQLAMKPGGSGDRIARIISGVFVEASDYPSGAVGFEVIVSPILQKGNIPVGTPKADASLAVCMGCYELADRLREIADKLDQVESVAGVIS